MGLMKELLIDGLFTRIETNVLRIVVCWCYAGVKIRYEKLLANGE